MARLTVGELLELKGKRQVTEIFCDTVDEAIACEEAGVDMIVTYLNDRSADFRTAAPDLFITLGIEPNSTATADEAVRAGLRALDLGADAVYCGAGFSVIEAMANEGIPTVGHVGYVPYRSTWYGGPRAVGKTAAEATELYRRALRYQDAGAFAIELELVPTEAAAEISNLLDMLVISMGSGSRCDGQYLFATDVLGKNTGHIPRHARVYRNLAAEYERLQQETVAAFSEFVGDVNRGEYPNDSETITMKDDELAALRAALTNEPRPSQHPVTRQIGRP